MYTIIGGDGKEYGPISEADLRKWIAEGRLNAQSLAKAESDAEFRPLSTFPELADVLGIAVAEAPAFAPIMDWSERDYELDIGGCVSRGWNVFKENLGTIMGGFLLYFILLMVAGACMNFSLITIIPKEAMANTVFKIFFNIFFQAVLALVAGPLTGGYYYMFIRALRGQPASIGDVFVGFQRAYVQLFLGYFIISFVGALCMIPYTITEGAKLEPLLAQFRQGSAPDQMQSILPQLGSAFASTLPVLLICLVPLTYFIVSFQFTVPLIIDKGMDFGTAIKTSWKMVHKHWWTVFGLVVVVGLVTVAGGLACCIGILFTIPLGAAALMSGYETIFSESRAA
jgi:uncharacterized membrane protein